MTTVVANLEAMAADTRCTYTPFFHTPKIHRLPSPAGGESLFGICGDLYLALLVLEWIKSGDPDRTKLLREIPEYADRNDVDILELHKSGLYLWSAWGIRAKILDSTYGVGSGGAIALRRLRDGRSLESALAGAIEMDNYTGNPINIEYLNPKKRKARKPDGETGSPEPQLPPSD